MKLSDWSDEGSGRRKFLDPLAEISTRSSNIEAFEKAPTQRGAERKALEKSGENSGQCRLKTDKSSDVVSMP